MEQLDATLVGHATLATLVFICALAGNLIVAYWGDNRVIAAALTAAIFALVFAGVTSSRFGMPQLPGPVAPADTP